MHWYMAITIQWLFYNYTMIENDTFLRNESRPLKFLYFRQVVVSAKCLFGDKSVRHTVRWTKCSFDKVSVGKMSVRQSVFGQSVFRQNVRVPALPLHWTVVHYTVPCFVFLQQFSGDTIICEFVSFRNSSFSTHKKSKFKFICEIICKQIAVNGNRHFCILIVVHLILQTIYVLETRVTY